MNKTQLIKALDHLREVVWELEHALEIDFISEEIFIDIKHGLQQAGKAIENAEHGEST